MRVTAGIRCTRGFTYLGVLFAVVFMGIALALAGQIWSTLDRRAKEQQLLFIGAQFRDALMRYYNGAPPGARRQFPMTLDDLVRDRRYPDTRRYLRKIYADPLTGKTEWGFVRGPGGEITAVHSRAAGVPIKTANFGDDLPFGGAKSYAEWIFRAPVTEQAAADAAMPIATPSRITGDASVDASRVQTAPTAPPTGAAPCKMVLIGTMLFCQDQ